VRIGCVFVRYFGAAALVRSEPGLRDRPVAVVRGAAPARVLVDATPEARAMGVEPGMPEAQARARCPDLITRVVSEERDGLAHTTLLATVLGTSPRVEDGGPGVVYVDLEGLGRLFGDEAAIGDRLWRHTRGIGLPACIGIASSRASAWAAARLGRPVTVVAPGGEAAVLGDAPLDLLDLPLDVHATLARWGVHTVEELAKLPRAGLAQRLGEAGLKAQDLARGVDATPFRLYTSPPFYQEAQGLEWEIASLERLEPVVQSLLDRLVARLHVSHLGADRLTVELGLASRARDERRIALAHPLADARTMLALLRLDLEAHPVSSAIVHVAVSAHPVRVHVEQGRLGRPPGPGARDLSAVLARLSGLVGPANLGSPAMVDSHRPDAFQVLPFDPSPRRGLDPGAESSSRGRQDGFEHQASRGRQDGPEPQRPRNVATDGCSDGLLVVRWLRPRVAAEVQVYAERPVWVAAGSVAGHVVACAGPWRTSGEWWRQEASGSGGPGGSSSPGGWAHDEWDLALSDSTLCRLVWDHRARAWFLDGIYD
jgi:protein ImuB